MMGKKVPQISLAGRALLFHVLFFCCLAVGRLAETSVEDALLQLPQEILEEDSTIKKFEKSPSQLLMDDKIPGSAASALPDDDVELLEDGQSDSVAEDPVYDYPPVEARPDTKGCRLNRRHSLQCNFRNADGEAVIPKYQLSVERTIIRNSKSLKIPKSLKGDLLLYNCRNVSTYDSLKSPASANLRLEDEVVVTNPGRRFEAYESTLESLPSGIEYIRIHKSHINEIDGKHIRNMEVDASSVSILRGEASRRWSRISGSNITNFAGVKVVEVLEVRDSEIDEVSTNGLLFDSVSLLSSDIFRTRIHVVKTRGVVVLSGRVHIRGSWFGSLEYQSLMVENTGQLTLESCVIDNISEDALMALNGGIIYLRNTTIKGVKISSKTMTSPTYYPTPDELEKLKNAQSAVMMSASIQSASLHLSEEAPETAAAGLAMRQSSVVIVACYVATKYLAFNF